MFTLSFCAVSRLRPRRIVYIDDNNSSNNKRRCDVRISNYVIVIGTRVMRREHIFTALCGDASRLRVREITEKYVPFYAIRRFQVKFKRTFCRTNCVFFFSHRDFSFPSFPFLFFSSLLQEV